MSRRRERGAALLIVLLLVATLSFIAVSIADLMLIASGRSVNARLRAELMWRVFAAEILAREAIETAAKTEGFRFAADNPFFTTPQNAPMDDGGAVLSFRDGSVCFNVNSLGEADENPDGGSDSPAQEEFARVLDAAGARGVNPEAVAAVLRDWIDADSFQEPSGAEDGYYAGLPAPYRTGGAPLADISELRAMSGIDAKTFLTLRALACALPTAVPAAINVNMLVPADAPVLAGLVGGELSLADAEEIIRDRPPGGYNSAEEFWRLDAFAGREISQARKARARVASDYVAVEAAVRLNDRTATLTMLFQLDSAARARLVQRQIGTLP